jgi:hypothetical protein
VQYTVVVMKGGNYGTAAINGPISQPPDDTQVNMEQQWNDIDRGTLKNSEKYLSQFHLSTTNPTQTDHGVKPGLHREKPMTNHLNCGTATCGICFLSYNRAFSTTPRNSITIVSKAS